MSKLQINTHLRAGILLTLVLIPTVTCQGPSGNPGYLDPEEWAVELDLRVGSIDDSTYSLTSIGDLAVSPSGRIYSLHGRRELVVRAFESDGALLGVIGGRGEGPGEFQGLLKLGFLGDTLWVLDHSLFRFSLFTEEGQFLSSFSVPFRFQEEPGQPPANAWGLLSDGTVWGFSFVSPFELEDGTVTEQHIVVMSPDNVVTDTIASIPVGKNNWTSAPGGAMLRQPFRGGPLHGFFPNELAALTVRREAPSSPEDAKLTLLKMTLANDTVFVREFGYEPIPIPRAEIDSILDSNVTSRRSRDWLDDRLYKPPFRPPVTSMVLGMDGWIWLRGNPTENAGVPWFALDPDGTPAGRIPLPAGLRVFAGDAFHLWGAEKDELDVPYLVRYRIVRE